MEPFQLRNEQAIPYFSLLLWEREFPHLTAGISARNSESFHDPNLYNYALHVGSDPDRVLGNRRRLAEALNIPPASWTYGEQVHGTRIREVTNSEKGRGRHETSPALEGTDGLLTGEEEIFLFSFYADCVPLFFYSPDRGLVGVAHAGWRGTVGGIGPAMVEEFVSRGADRGQIRAAIAPSIGPCCYEVDDKVSQPLIKALPEADVQVLQPAGPGKWNLDLKEANRQLLLDSGLSGEHILVTHWCTSCHPELFHSHRRDQGKTGRMAAFIGKRKG
ncbi:peptidoglycan editing factor PgeF [Salinithrix halophila]|uniref:Purine nucleoside phosphorylase n=1 Tax=Salinithrix halophila TaxID=1485204 RepID=A0ABV8JDH8_9BACL